MSNDLRVLFSQKVPMDQAHCPSNGIAKYMGIGLLLFSCHPMNAVMLGGLKELIVVMAATYLLILRGTWINNHLTPIDY